MARPDEARGGNHGRDPGGEVPPAAETLALFWGRCERWEAAPWCTYNQAATDRHLVRPGGVPPLPWTTAGGHRGPLGPAGHPVRRPAPAAETINRGLPQPLLTVSILIHAVRREVGRRRLQRKTKGKKGGAGVSVDDSLITATGCST